MKLTSAFASILLILPNAVARPDQYNEEETTPSLRASHTPPRSLQGNSANARVNARGQLLAKGNFGKIDISSDTNAKNGAKGILKEFSKTAPGLSKNTTFVPIKSHQSKNSNAKHIKMMQQVHGMDVEGASLFVHTNEEGEVTGINGELVPDEKVPSVPTIAANKAIKAALKESRVPQAEHFQCTAPTLTVVRGFEDGNAYLAWTCSVRYDMLGEDGNLKPFNDKIFAKASGDTPGLIQIHPLIFGATPTMNTRDCQNGTRDCVTVSTSSSKISTGDLALNSAHNYAIDTYNYYFEKHGRDSLDGNGMTLISRVHYSTNYVNAFWDGNRMTYGDGDGVQSDPLSQDADVVAHELTHGVTENESNLVYNNESGALNEALSDIFAALVEHYIDPTISDTSLWLLGEDIWTPNTPGDALRSMCDPAVYNDFDYYPTRYQGTQDNGGVHWNSGIANLAACLMINGGTHPRGKTSNDVPKLGATRAEALDVLGEIFYEAQVGCLTSGSDFAAVRYCTAQAEGGVYETEVNAAWDAVGVPNNEPPEPTDPMAFTLNLQGTGTFIDQAADAGGLQQYTMTIGQGSSVSCSIGADNGDADLYVKFGSEAIPDSNSPENNCASFSSNSIEGCTTGNANTAGTMVYAAVHAYTGYEKLTISCTENTPSTGNCPFCPNGDECCAPSQCSRRGKKQNRGCRN